METQARDGSLGRRLPPITAANRRNEQLERAKALATRLGRTPVEVGERPRPLRGETPRGRVPKGVLAALERVVVMPMPRIVPMPMSVEFLRVVGAVAAVFGVRAEEIIGQARATDIVMARHAAVWVAKKVTRKSLVEIGRRCGGRDHSTVWNSLRRAEARRASDAAYREATDRILSRLGR